MTRSRLVHRLGRYALAGHSRAWTASEVLGCCRANEHGTSTSYSSCSSSSPSDQVMPERPSGVRTFCAVPATATTTAQVVVTSSAKCEEGTASGGHWVLDPTSAAEYDRRLREFLTASRSLRDFPTAQHRPSMASPSPRPGQSSRQSTSQSPVDKSLNEELAAGHGEATAAATAAASAAPMSRASPASETSGITSVPPSPSWPSPSASRAHSAAAVERTASAARARAREALRDVPDFTPPRIGGCSSSGTSPSPAAAAAAAGLPQPHPEPQPHLQPQPYPHPQPHPHPASPTPVDWREMLQRARQLLGSRQVAGPEMLMDKFSRQHTYLRISLTERCNLRCTYCMPDEGVALTPTQQLLTTPEIMRLAGIFVEAGVTKIRLTGGEPTLRRDIGDLVRQLSALRPMGLRSVAITSNGIVLGRQLPALKEAGLTAVNISLDTLRPERFERLARRPGHKRVLDSIRTAVDLGYDPVKVNVVVMRGVNDDEVADFAALTRDQPINVRFIEYMPFDGNVWSDSKMVPYRELVSCIQAAFPDAPLERLDDPLFEVAKNFRLRGHRGSVSFITSMTQHFCSDCNRLRLLADGNLKVCLFGASEVSLRDAMRGGASDDDLRAIISAAVGRKRAAHAGMFELAASANRPMITIGG